MVSLRLKPVIQSQSRDVLEVAGIVRDECQVMDARHSGNQQVGPTYGDASPQHIAAQLTKLDGTIAIKIEHEDVGKQFRFNAVNKCLRR